MIILLFLIEKLITKHKSISLSHMLQVTNSSLRKNRRQKRSQKKYTSQKISKSYRSQKDKDDWDKVITDIDKLTNKIRNLSQPKKSKIKKGNKKNKSHIQGNYSLYNSTSLLQSKRIQLKTQQSEFPTSEYLKLSSEISHKSLNKLNKSYERCQHSAKKQNNVNQQSQYKINLKKQSSKGKRCNLMKQQCLTGCHKVMLEMSKLKQSNQILLKKASDLQRKIFFSEIEKKQLRKKVDRSILENAIKSYNKQNKKIEDQEEHIFSRTPKDNLTKILKEGTYLRVPLQNDSTFYETQTNNYKSIQLKSNMHHQNTLYEQMPYKIKSLALKTSATKSHHQNYDCKTAKSKIIDLSVKQSSRKHEDYSTDHINKKQYRNNKGLAYGVLTECQNMEKNLQKSKNFDKVNSLQQYFDELVEISRFERNKMKKKIIWAQMKDVAQQLKEIKQQN